MSKEQEFVSLNLPEDDGPVQIQSGGLEFLASNYEFNNTKGSDNSGDSSTFNFGDMSKLNVKIKTII